MCLFFSSGFSYRARLVDPLQAVLAGDRSVGAQARAVPAGDRSWIDLFPRLEGLWYPQPIKVQILVLAFISGFISGFPAMWVQWEETFPSTTRRLR